MTFKKYLTAFIALFYLTALKAELPTIPWAQPTYTYLAKEQNVVDVLKTFASNQDINIVVNPNITGIVSLEVKDTPSDEFFRELARSYGLIWFYDGNVLYVDRSVDVKSTIIPLRYSELDGILSVVEALGFVSSSWSVRALEAKGLGFVSGPPKFTETILAIASTFEVKEEKRLVETDSIKVFTLDNAWADDHEISRDGSSVIVPGVASVLRSIVEGGVPPSVYGKSSLAEGVNKYTNKQEPLSGLGLPAEENKSGAYQENEPNKEKKTTGRASSSMIFADPRLNAVIVKTVEANIPLYESAIKELDRPVAVIHIEAAIIDVDVNYTFELGNQLFRLTRGSQDIAFNIAGSSTISNIIEGAANLQYSGVVNGFNFLAKIKSLVTDNKAQVLKRPSLLTLDNIEAIIQSKETVFQSVTSERTNSLYDISSGTTLRVTPHLLASGGKIKLLVNIQDGAVTQPAAGDTTLISTNETVINTQAVINEGESLLIGGNYIKRKDFVDTGVPYLRNIPLLGYLFKTRAHTDRVVDRMFLITPKIINVAQESKELDPKYFDKDTRVAYQTSNSGKGAELVDPVIEADKSLTSDVFGFLRQDEKEVSSDTSGDTAVNDAKARKKTRKVGRGGARYYKTNEPTDVKESVKSPTSATQEKPQAQKVTKTDTTTKPLESKLFSNESNDLDEAILNSANQSNFVQHANEQSYKKVSTNSVEVEQEEPELMEVQEYAEVEKPRVVLMPEDEVRTLSKEHRTSDEPQMSLIDSLEVTDEEELEDLDLLVEEILAELEEDETPEEIIDYEFEANEEMAASNKIELDPEAQLLLRDFVETLQVAQETELKKLEEMQQLENDNQPQAYLAVEQEPSSNKVDLDEETQMIIKEFVEAIQMAQEVEMKKMQDMQKLEVADDAQEEIVMESSLLAQMKEVAPQEDVDEEAQMILDNLIKSMRMSQETETKSLESPESFDFTFGEDRMLQDDLALDEDNFSIVLDEETQMVLDSFIETVKMAQAAELGKEEALEDKLDTITDEDVALQETVEAKVQETQVAMEAKAEVKTAEVLEQEAKRARLNAKRKKIADLFAKYTVKPTADLDNQSTIDQPEEVAQGFDTQSATDDSLDQEERELIL